MVDGTVAKQPEQVAVESASRPLSGGAGLAPIVSLTPPPPHNPGAINARRDGFLRRHAILAIGGKGDAGAILRGVAEQEAEQLAGSEAQLPAARVAAQGFEVGHKFARRVVGRGGEPPANAARLKADVR